MNNPYQKIPFTERRFVRRSVNTEVMVRNTMGVRKPANLFNLSEAGCAICLPEPRLTVRGNYTIKIEGLESIPAVVVWARDTYYGLEFVYSLHTTVVDHISSKCAAPDRMGAGMELLVEIVSTKSGASRRPFDPPSKK